MYTGGTVARERSVSTATRYGLDGLGIESRWKVRFSAPVQTGPEAHPASYTMGTRSFLGEKRPGRGVDHPPLPSAEAKERIDLLIYSNYGLLWPVLGWILPELITGSYLTRIVAGAQNDHSPPFSAEVKNEWSYTIIPLRLYGGQKDDVILFNLDTEEVIGTQRQLSIIRYCCSLLIRITASTCVFISQI